MADVNWTPAQKSAVQDNGGTLLVSAAAGSGKTAVLTARVVRLLTDEAHPVAPQQLLIVTFTNAAAAELRQRIAAGLSAACNSAPQNDYLRRQRLMLGRAAIGTIDSYCLNLLQQHFNHVENLPADFRLADDALLLQLRQDAMRQTLEEMYEDADFGKFAAMYGRARSDLDAERAIAALHAFARTQPWPQQALQRLLEPYDAAQPLCGTAWGHCLLVAALREVENALSLCRCAQQLAGDDEALVGAYLPALQEDEAFLQRLAEKLHGGAWDEAFQLVAAYKQAGIKAVRGYEGAAKEQVKTLRGEVKSIVCETLHTRLIFCTEEDFAADIAAAAPMVHALVKAALKYYELYKAARFAEKALDFADVEHLALSLLCDEHGVRTPLARQLSQNFAAVMVDEYQDTNRLQEQLYTCLAREAGDNLFCVGDVKQSIYRFRQASPEIFLEKKATFAPYDGQSYPAVLTLGHNFRSAESVIDFVNFVFTQCMCPAVGDVDYNENEMLVPGVRGGFDGGSTELYIVDTGLLEESTGFDDAATVAHIIRDKVQAGMPVRDKSGTRPCNYGDYCILVRTRGGFSAYEAALRAENIPVFADTAESWLQDPYVAALTAVLRAVDNPRDEISLAAAMLSPLYRLTPTHLAEVRAESRRGSFYGAVLASTDAEVQAFAADIRHVRVLAATLPMDKLCEEILQRTHGSAMAGAAAGAVQHREALRRFTALAANFASEGSGTLAGFLRRIDSYLESGVQANAAQRPAGCVGIMTIHRSKGLEFPVVIVADTAHLFNEEDTRAGLQLHPQLGVGFALRAGTGDLYPTVMQRAISTVLQAESRSEEMRALYVALTRAKDKLIITVPLKNPQRTLEKLALHLQAQNGAAVALLGEARNFAHWLLIAALQHPDADELRKAAGAAVLPCAPTNSRMEVVFADAENTAVQAPQAYTLSAAPDAALVAQLAAGFAQAYPFAVQASLPVKRSVSSLAHKDAVAVPARPSFMYKTGLTAAERGTAMHAFLQFANFAAVQKDAAAERERLVQQGFLAGEVAAALPMDTVQAFVASPLFGRILQADAVLRETEFITQLPAGVAEDVTGATPQDTILVQGVADLILCHDGALELVDYKTDAHKTEAQFLESYAAQLALYKMAMEKRLQTPVAKCTIYSFTLGEEIDVPFALLTV